MLCFRLQTAVQKGCAAAGAALVRISSWCLVGVCCIGSSAARGDDSPVLRTDTIERVVAQAEPSVVSILRVRRAGSTNAALSAEPTLRGTPPDEKQELLPNDYGAGILVKGPQDDELFILTAYHVVRGGPEYSSPRADATKGPRSDLRLTFHNRRTCAGVIFAADPRTDLAVLAFDRAQLGGRPDELNPLDWQNSRPVKKGEVVVCLGNPYALARDGSASVTWGIISNLGRRPALAARDTIFEQSLFHLGTVLQIDARLQLGGSGGPIVNLEGQLVGIGTALAAIEGYEKSAGFAIPTAPPMRRVIETLLAGQEVEYGLLGVAPRDVPADELRQNEPLYSRQPTAVQIAEINPRSPAHSHLKVGDVLLAIDDQTLYSSADLMRVVGEKGPEDEVTALLFRPARKDPLSGKYDLSRGEMLTVRSKLAKWPVRDDEGIIAARPKYPEWRGLRIDYTTSRQKFFTEKQFLSGVMVVDVAPNSPAETALLQPGVVITQVGNVEVRNPAEFHHAVDKLRGDVVLHLDGSPAMVTISD